MSEKSTIEWTNATWNPMTGCTKIGDGCENCYAHALAEVRLRKVYLAQSPAVNTAKNRKDPFAVRLWPERLGQPERWQEPRLVFVNSMSDMFHIDIPNDYLREVFKVMLRVDHHAYQVLTKRPARALSFWEENQDLFSGKPIPAHIWIGASIENQKVAYRLKHLVSVPARTRFLSCEPLLGPLDLDLEGIHWLIAGGESGPAYRECDPLWVVGVRDQCLRQRVPFFFKQWGGRTPKSKGRSLEGRTWDQLPKKARSFIPRSLEPV